jgi:hypothetical protein
MLNKSILKTISIIFIVVGLCFLVASALDGQRGPKVASGEGSSEESLIYRQGVSRVLHDFSEKEREQIEEHRQLVYYQLSDKLFAREDLSRGDIWMGKLAPNLLGLGWVCGEFIEDGGMSDPYFQHPFYYSFGTWKPDMSKDDLILDPGPFRTLNVNTLEIQFDLKKEDFFALGLPYAPSKKLDMNYTRTHFPVIRVAAEACIYRGVANYTLILLGVLGILLQAVIFKSVSKS